MKTLLKLLLFVLVALALVSLARYAYRTTFQEKEEHSEKDLELVTKEVSFDGDIQTLRVATGIKADYQVKDTTGVRLVITTTPKCMEQLQTKMTDGKLELYFQHMWRSFRLYKDTHITIIASAAPEIDLSSGASLKVSDGYEGLSKVGISSGAHLNMDNVVSSQVKFRVSSGANADVCISHADSIAADVTSGGALCLKGEQNNFVSLLASSGGSINATEMQATTGKAKASSGASIRCDIPDLKSETSSGGSIKNRK